MHKMNVLVVVLSVVFANPLLADWVYQGTTSYVSPPDSDYAADGSWWYSWDGQGTAYGSPGLLHASGWTRGECAIRLSPAAGTPLQLTMSIWSKANGQSIYEWQGSGSRYIQVVIDSTITSASIEYSGYGVDDTRVSTASASSGASADAGGGVSGVTFSYPGGYGSGCATTYTGSGASNTPDNVTVSQDWVDWWYPPPYDYNVGYEGVLSFTASYSTPPYGSYPQGDLLVVSATVGGSAFVQANIQQGAPSSVLRAGSDGAYAITGTAEVHLYGNIR